MSTRRHLGGQLLGVVTSGCLAGYAGIDEPDGISETAAMTRLTSIDTHAHVFTRTLPMPDPRRAPSGYDATPADYLRQLDRHDISHGVVVQPSFLGTDNSYLVAALKAHPTRLRGVAVVSPGIDDAALERLAEAGVVGIRLNLIGLPPPDFSREDWKSLLRQLADHHWQVEVHQMAEQLQPVVEPLLAVGLDVVIDHFGRPNPMLGTDDPGFHYLLSLGTTRKVWVKLSGAYRNGTAGRGEAIAVAAIPLLRSSFGLERLVWGSDWPHTLFETTARYDVARLSLDRWLPSADDRQIVLADAPAQLFQFTVKPASAVL